MTQSEEQRKIFWKMYQDFLEQNEIPFTISPTKQWAVVQSRGHINAYESFNKPFVTIEFLFKKKLIRCGIYIQDDLNLYSFLEANRTSLDKGFNVKPDWKVGDRNKNTRKIQVEFPFVPFSPISYQQTIIKSIPYVMQFINNYGKFFTGYTSNKF